MRLSAARAQTLGLAVSASFLFSGLLIPSSHASEGVDESDALQAIEEVTPSILDESVGTGQVEVADTGAIDVADAAPVDGTVAPGVSFNVDYAASVTASADGITEFDTDHADVTAVVQSTGFGVRVLTVIEGSSAPASYSYTFDVAPTAELVDGGSAFYLVDGDELLGTLLDPWAVDAEGDAIPTNYVWSGGVLTQEIDLSAPGISYPVVADPAWSYSYKFATTKTAAANKALLKKCFNCYFPVSGAPKAFPAVGTLLPLKVVGANFECKFKSEFSGTNYFGFQFDATKNHVDKLGSNIIFQFMTISGKKYLVVSAYIVNDAFWIKNAFYRSGAVQTWQDFATKLNKA